MTGGGKGDNQCRWSWTAGTVMSGVNVEERPWRVSKVTNKKKPEMFEKEYIHSFIIQLA